MHSVVYLDGEFVPYEKALVHVEDRGYVFADGIYEVVRIYGGRFFTLDEHMTRLVHSAEAIRLPLPPEADLRAAMQEMKARARGHDAVLYLQITRGNAPRDHRFPALIHPKVFMIVRPYARPAAKDVQAGVGCITVPDVRWHLCNVKSIGLLPNVLARQQAAEAGAFEAVFVRDGVITECSSSNFFIVQGETVVTHPADNHILPGITRALVLEMAGRLGIAIREEAFAVAGLKGATEAFLTSTGSEVLPVTRVDGAEIGDGRPGEITMRLWREFDRLVQEAPY